MKEKDYTIRTNVNGQYEIGIVRDGKAVSRAGQREFYTVMKNGKAVKRLETKTQVIKRLCNELGVEY